jgi:hypothetical protein
LIGTTAKRHPYPVRKGAKAEQHYYLSDERPEYGDSSQDYVQDQADYQG